MKKRGKYNAYTSFLDLLFITVLGFAAMFFLALILMNQKTTTDSKITPKADFIITFTWPKESGDDVDAYLEDPMGHLVFFRRREDGLMHLDRDDLGKRNDVIQTDLGPIEYQLNQEIITIRGIIPGEYTIAVHMYHKMTESEYGNYDGEHPEASSPTEVTVKVEKMNPHVKLIALKKVKLENNGDEVTVLRFTLDKQGKVTEMNELPKPIANKKLGGE